MFKKLKLTRNQMGSNCCHIHVKVATLHSAVYAQAPCTDPENFIGEGGSIVLTFFRCS